MKRLQALVTLSATLLTGFVLGCRGGDEADLMTRAEFVSTYVDLRVAALRREDETLTDSARAAVLARHGVSEGDLLDFASTHGGDLEFMREVWNEVEARLDSVPMVPEDEAS